MITLSKLIQVGVGPTQARQFINPIQNTCADFGIILPIQEAAFVAQALHESNKFIHLEENLYYTTPERIHAVWPSRVTLEEAKLLVRNPEKLANKVYANRLGNGDEESGDGYLYLGRGIFQLTGRTNYRNAQQDTGYQYEIYPALVAQPEHAARTAGWYWHINKLNNYTNDFDEITRKIHGNAMLGAAERRELFIQCIAAFS